MGVIDINSTQFGAVTPICNDCGIHLCWDVDIYEYEEHKKFWDNWRCKSCNPDYKGSAVYA